MSKIYSVIVDVAHVESSFKNKKKQMRIDIQEGCMDETSLIMLLTSDALLPNASFAWQRQRDFNTRIHLRVAENSPDRYRKLQGAA